MAVSVGLSGCGELNSQFTCPMKPGVTCQSLDQVNTMVDQGKLAQNKIATIPHSTLAVDMHNASDPVVRSPDNVMKLWIAPYQDTQGNYFSSTMAYHVIQPGNWADESTKEVGTHA
jgi:conjugal transfer pilus assembly protein TraV